MGLQDLTPQLRTRLNRMERAVGWFVFLATALLVFGFGYYLFKTAKRKGWFIPRAPYYTFTDRATGLKVGDPVVLMGFEVGQITLIDTMPPWSPYNVYVEFEVKEPYNGYLWTGHSGSRARVATADLFKRVLEVTKGTDGYPAYRFNPLRQIALAEAKLEPHPERWELGAEYYDRSGTNLLYRAQTMVTAETLQKLAAIGEKSILVLETNEVHKTPTVVWDDQTGSYTNFIRTAIPGQNLKANLYWMVADETPALTERLDDIAEQVQKALPNFLRFTNQLAVVLANSTTLTSNLNALALSAQPTISNLTFLTSELRGPGALGDWALGPTSRLGIETTISNANQAVIHADTNVTMTLEKLAVSLDELAGITGNLRKQVDANTNVLGALGKAIVDADDLVQGLKRHWFLRSAFKPESAKGLPSTNSAPATPVRSPRDAGSR